MFPVSDALAIEAGDLFVIGPICVCAWVAGFCFKALHIAYVTKYFGVVCNFQKILTKFYWTYFQRLNNNIYNLSYHYSVLRSYEHHISVFLF